MLKDEISLVPVKNSFVRQLLEISRICKLSLWSPEDYKTEIQRNDSFSTACIINSSDEVIGFILARLIMTNTSYKLSQNSKTKFFQEAEILNIAVSPQYQKQSVGQIIFDYFVNFCLENQIENIWLEVRQSNSPALSFYNKNGFQTVYVRKNYYQIPVEDALVLKMELVLNKF